MLLILMYREDCEVKLDRDGKSTKILLQSTSKVITFYAKLAAIVYTDQA